MVKKYKVGGYVRDKIIGIKSQDIDYVIVGATIEYMHQQGFIPVGRHFPVFIDPTTQTQYALARTERKTGVGYHGFEFYAATDVTLEQDLKRRDLTINAIAEDENGEFIDPFNGINDIRHKIIRHTSLAFAEDPLRVLRAARFRAKLGFNIASETLELMRQICTSNELEHLSAERIWDEVRKALNCPNPLEFFCVLNQVGALDHILNEFKIIVENNPLYIKTTTNLETAIKLEYPAEIKFAIIISNIATYDMGLATNISKICKLGHHYTELGLVISHNLNLLLSIEKQTPDSILQLIKNIDPIRRAKRFKQICQVLEITYAETQQLHIQFIQEIANCFKQIKYSKFDTTNSKQLTLAINNKKLAIITDKYKQFFGT